MLLEVPIGVGGAQVDDWSPDGRFITYNQDPSLKALPVSGGPSTAFVTTQGKNVDESHFSPDGRWIAYNSNDSGVWQVYVAPFPATGQRWQISANGGVDARWRGDGKELFYLSFAAEMMSVEIGTSEDSLTHQRPGGSSMRTLTSMPAWTILPLPRTAGDSCSNDRRAWLQGSLDGRAQLDEAASAVAAGPSLRWVAGLADFLVEAPARHARQAADD